MSVRKEIRDLWLRQATTFGCGICYCNQVRICRNLQGYPFPIKASSADRQAISLKIQKALSHFITSKRDWGFIHWNTCTDSERQIVKRLCDLEFPCEETVVIFNKTKYGMFVINDGDALKIQEIKNHPVDFLWHWMNEVDDKLQEYLPYAFDPEKGYATSSPSNYGSGLDIRAYVHIPALCFKQKLLQIQDALKVMQLRMDAVEVIEDKILGHQFYVTNTVAQGCSEEELLKHVDAAAQDIAKQEEALRVELWQDDNNFMRDSIARALGVLKSCYELSFEEGMNLISVALMGMDMGIVPKEDRFDLVCLWRMMPRELLCEFCHKRFASLSEKEIRAFTMHDYFDECDRDLIEEVHYVS